jgi:MFS family permease
MGVFGTIWDSGEAAGPILAGLLIASVSYVPAFGIVAAMMILMAILFLVAVRDPMGAREPKPDG